jgi:hypothetical protein
MSGQHSTVCGDAVPLAGPIIHFLEKGSEARLSPVEGFKIATFTSAAL